MNSKLETWTVQEAKAHLSELMRKARAGHPQRIGTSDDDACVLLTARQWAELNKPKMHLGRWLVENAPRSGELKLPSRKDKRGNPFEW